MKAISKLLTLAVVLMLAASVASFGQVQPTFTTLSSAVGERGNALSQIRVASATGFVASNTVTGLDYYIFVDHELMRITAVSGTTITVQRGQGRTNVSSHASGAHVFVGVAPQAAGAASGQTGGPFISTPMWGSCTSSQWPVLPLIQVNPNSLGGQAMYNCNGGVWLKQDLPDDDLVEPLVSACSIPMGSVAYGSVGTNTTDVANKRMSSTIIVPRSGFYTGIQVLQGGTATTDNITAQISDSGGKVVATGAAAGVLLSGASTFLNVPFALNRAGAAQTTTLITGPALYITSIVGNGTAAGAYRTIAASTFNNVLTQGTTSITFGTFPDFTPATTFTADLGPVTCLYH